MRLPSDEALFAEQLRRSFLLFVATFWPLVVPSPFVPGWHLELIGAKLSEVAHGDLLRLLIAAPPRHGKTLMVSVLFPAWVWTFDPSCRFLYVSYSAQAATRDSPAFRRLVTSPLYRELFGIELTDDQNAQERMGNSLGGLRVAVGFGGSITGEGADVVLVDDPHRLFEGLAPVMRGTSIDEFKSTIPNRLNDPRTGRIVVAGQRVHERDLMGGLLDEGGWVHVVFPLEHDPSHPQLHPEDPRREEGEPLWPERYGAAEIERMKSETLNWQAVFQQLPRPSGAGVIDPLSLCYYGEHQLPERPEQVVAAWDLAYGESMNADYTVGQVWVRYGTNCYLVKEVRRKMNTTAIIEAIRATVAWTNERFPGQRGHPILVERAANGQPVVDLLKDEIPGLRAVPPEGTKETRLQAVEPLFTAGQVHVPGCALPTGLVDRTRTPKWVCEFIDELIGFPYLRHDDRVDAAALALDHLRSWRPPKVRGVWAPIPPPHFRTRW